MSAPKNTDRRDLVAVLVATAREDDLDLARARLSDLDPRVVPTLVHVARAHGMEAWLAAVAPGRDGPWAELAAQRARFLASQARSRAELAALAGCLQEHGRAWAVLKGPSVAALYPRPDLRYSVDIDVLVPPAHFESVVDDLVRAGYRLLDVNWPLLAERQPGQLRLTSIRGILVDLHWNLLNQMTLRAALRIRTTDLLSRARWSGDRAVRVLDPEDQLAHVSMHAALGGGGRLSWLVDIDRIIRSTPPDWDVLTRRTAAARTGPLAAVALARTSFVLGTQVPATVISQLAGGRGWLALRRLIDGRSGLPLDPSDPSLSRAFSSSMRAGAWRTQFELGRRGAGWIRSGAPRTRVSPSWLDPGNSSSALHAVDDAAARRSYFRSVQTSN